VEREGELSKRKSEKEKKKNKLIIDWKLLGGKLVNYKKRKSGLNQIVEKAISGNNPGKSRMPSECPRNAGRVTRGVTTAPPPLPL